MQKGHRRGATDLDGEEGVEEEDSGERMVASRAAALSGKDNGSKSHEVRNSQTCAEGKKGREDDHTGQCP